MEGTPTYGSSGQWSQAAWGGGKAEGFNRFFSGMGFHESGWRTDSPSDVRQGFGRLGWRTEKTDLALTMSYAYNTMIRQRAAQDYQLLERNYTSEYTIPDKAAGPSLSFSNFIGRHTFNVERLMFSGNAWYRNIRTEGINPNFNTDALGNSIYQPSAAEQTTLTAAGYTGFPTAGAAAANTPFPKWRCIANAIEQNDPDERCDAVTIYSKEVQNDYGFSGQITWVTLPSVWAITTGSLLERRSIAAASITPKTRLTAI